MNAHNFILVAFWACALALFSNICSLATKRGVSAISAGLDITFGAFMMFWGGNLLGWW